MRRSRSRSSDVACRTLISVRRDFARWRSRREPGGRIPAALWAAAADLVGQHGVSKTSQALGLDYYALKKHAGAAAGRKPSFVEVTLPSLSPGSECWMEVENGRGTRLRVELRGASAAEVESLARALWSEGR
jgi:hypothetical protein